MEAPLPDYGTPVAQVALGIWARNYPISLWHEGQIVAGSSDVGTTSHLSLDFVREEPVGGGPYILIQNGA